MSATRQRVVRASVGNSEPTFEGATTPTTMVARPMPSAPAATAARTAADHVSNSSSSSYVAVGMRAEMHTTTLPYNVLDIHGVAAAPAYTTHVTRAPPPPSSQPRHALAVEDVSSSSHGTMTDANYSAPDVVLAAAATGSALPRDDEHDELPLVPPQQYGSDKKSSVRAADADQHDDEAPLPRMHAPQMLSPPPAMCVVSTPAHDGHDNNNSSSHHTSSSHHEAQPPAPPAQAKPETTTTTPPSQSLHTTAWQQFVATVRRSLLLQRRHPIAYACELLVAIVFVIGSIALWLIFGTSSEAAMVYYSTTNLQLSSLLYENAMALMCYNATMTGGVPIGNLRECSTMPPPLTPRMNMTLVCSQGPRPQPQSPQGDVDDDDDDGNVRGSGSTSDIPRGFCGTLTTGVLTYAAWRQLAQGNTTVVPALDHVVPMKWMNRLLYSRNSIFQIGGKTAPAAMLSGGTLLFSPDTAATAGLVAYLNATSTYFRYAYGGIMSAAEADERVASHRFGDPPIWAIVDVKQLSVDAFDVTLRPNATAVPSTVLTIARRYIGGLAEAGTELYLFAGMLTLQQAIYRYYLTHILNATLPFDNVALLPAPTAAYDTQKFLSFGGQLAPLILVLGFLYPVSQMTKRIVVEKELRLREAMLIMGVSEVVMYVAWVTIYMVQYAVVSLIMAMMLKLTYVTRSDFGVIFFLLYFFCLSIIALAGLMATLFSKARRAAIVAPLIYFVLSIPLFALENASNTARNGILVLSPSALAVGFDVLFEHELEGGLRGGSLRDFRDSPTMLTVIVVLFCDAVLYTLLMLYLDAVLPKEWGTRRHPLFFVRDPLRRLCGSSAQSRHSAGGGGEDGRYPDGVFEEDEDDDDDTNDDGDDDGRSRRCSVRMVGLRKQYRRNGKPFLAVNNFYWRLREGEIAVLLGHNGAGKTTLMSMLTGMTSPDAGDCFIYGHSVREELSRARQLIGFCPQHNILWPELTCREHLEYYAAIKGLRGSVLQESVQAMLREVDLLDKIDYPSRALSGGQKRKLSIAIAFVGRSPLVFLDEPTAGMDVAARRFTWELLKRMARSHTILLSTHYMDEADLLGDTVAIMNHGRLQCCGSNHFLKARLGAGYCLTVIVNNDLLLSAVHAVVLRVKPNATVLFCTSLQIVYELPHTDTYSIQCLIHELQCLSEEAGVCTFSISATTLEEVFLQLSMSKHAEEEGEDAAQSPASLRERGRAVWECSLMTGTAAMAWSQFKAMLRKRWLNGLRDRRTQFFQLICPIICVTMTVLLVAVKAAIVRRISASRAAYPVAVSLDVCNCDEALGNPLQAFGFALRTPVVANALDLSWYEVDRIAAYSTQHVGGMFCRDTNMRALTSAENNVVHLTNLTAPHQAPVNLQFYYSNLASQLSGVVHQLSLGINSLFDDGRNERTVDTYNDIIVGAIIMLPFTFLPSNPVAWVVKERECRARHLQRIAGLMFYVYWLSNYIYDVIAYVITSCLMLAIFAMFQRTEYVGPDTVGPFVVAMLEYGLCSTAMSYALSFFFHEHSSAQGSIMAFTFASGFLLVVLLFILSLNEDTKDVSRTLRWVFRLVPSFCIGEVIINLATNEQGKALHTWVEPWSMDIVGGPCIYMLAELPVFLLLTLLYDHPQWRIWMRGLRYKRTADAEVISDEDSDVDDERTEVYEQEANNHNEDLVRVVDLRKVYDNGKVAIRNLTFSILPHEVFGFLGTNGAGKTTTMSILCQEFLPTSGCAYVCAYDVAAESAEALRCIGYCPQFDATLDLLTVHDHLELYAGIRGIAYSERERVVDGIIQLCELSNYRNVLAHQLSGGNRRKLSVAIALVGGPPVVFLDEPSAGMDPVARRGLWNTIQTVSKDCSIVLTTHHLEEVEVLAHTIAIMANGTLRCIGDKTHLKQKYSSGYDLSLRLSDPELRYKVHSFVTRCCSEARLNEYKGNRLVYQLPSSTVLSTIFREMEANKARFRIADYSISQTSIEQVFLRISADARAKMLDRPTPPRFIRSHAVLRRYKGNSSAVRGGRPDSEWTTPSSLTSPSPTTLQTTMSRLTGQRQAMGSSPGTFQQQQQQVSPYDAVYDGATTADYTSSPHITFVVPPNDDFDYTDDVTAFDPLMGAAEANNATAMYVDNQGMNMYMGNAGAVYDNNNNNANAYFAGGNGQYNNNDAIDVEDDDDFVI